MLTKSPHRDLCLFFGRQGADRFYYVHFSQPEKEDPNAHSIFKVNRAPRVSIASMRTRNIRWGDGWHTTRVERDARTGAIAVYFDDLTKPIMRATDTTFVSGTVGIGSFDDLGWFRDVELRGEPAPAP